MKPAKFDRLVKLFASDVRRRIIRMLKDAGNTGLSGDDIRDRIGMTQASITMILNDFISNDLIGRRKGNRSTSSLYWWLTSADSDESAVISDLLDLMNSYTGGQELTYPVTEDEDETTSESEETTNPSETTPNPNPIPEPARVASRADIDSGAPTNKNRNKKTARA